MFKLRPGLQSTDRVNTLNSPLRLRTSVNYFSGKILESFALSEKRMEYNGTEIQEKNFFFPSMYLFV